MDLLQLVLFLAAQAPLAPGQTVDPKDIDEAIQRGVEFLRKQPPVLLSHEGILGDLQTIKLLTFVRAGVPESDPDLQRLFQYCLNFKMGGNRDSTYVIALLALGLEECDRVKAQKKLAQCAQFFVDSQCLEGRWTYSGGFAWDTHFPELDKPLLDQNPRLLAEDGKPKVLRRVVIRKAASQGRTGGDHSNSQYAALGLRACHDAGIVIPEETVHLAEKAWRESALDDPEGINVAKPAVSTGPGGGPASTAVEGKAVSWGYGAKTNESKGMASMTAGGVGSLIIFDYMLKKDWRKDPEVEAGIRWLGRHFEDRVIGGGHRYFLYSLYAFERVGTLYGTDHFGTHAWHAEGAPLLLKAQRADGSWLMGSMYANSTLDTCFAILFLKRATRPLIGRNDIATPGRPPPAQAFSMDPDAKKAPLEKSVADLAEKCMRSVAAVRAGAQAGVGFFLSPEGFLVTPYSIVSGSQGVTLDGKYEATIYAVDLKNDLALLKIKGDASPAALELDLPPSIKAGDPILAVGPLVVGRPLDQCVSNGTVLRLPLTSTAAIHPAYRGAPMCTMSGKVAGMSVPKEGDKESGAVPAELIKALLDGRDGEFRVTGNLAEWEMKNRLGSRYKVDPAKSIALDSSISRWIVDEENNRILALEPAMNSLIQISLSERSITRKTSTGADPSALCAAPGSPRLVWVGNRGARNVVKIDLDKGTVEETIPVPVAPATLLAARKYLWCVDADGSIHGVDPSEKKHIGRVPTDASMGVWYDSKRDHLVTCGRQWLCEYDASKLGPILRELSRQNLTAKERQELLQALDKARKTFPIIGGSWAPSRTVGYGFLADEKNGKLYVNKGVAKVDKPDTSLGIFKPNAPHSMSSDPSVRDFIKQNPFLDEILAVSPDGKWASTGTHLYNTASFTVQKELPLPSTLVAFTKDSRGLYYFDWVNRVIALLDVESK